MPFFLSQLCLYPVSKFRRLNLQNVSRIQSLLTTSTAPRPPVQATIISCLDYSNWLFIGLSASSLAQCLSSTQQSDDFRIQVRLCHPSTWHPPFPPRVNNKILTIVCKALRLASLNSSSPVFSLYSHHSDSFGPQYFLFLLPGIPF